MGGEGWLGVVKGGEGWLGMVWLGSWLGSFGYGWVWIPWLPVMGELVGCV